MRGLLNLMVLGGLLVHAPLGMAAEAWVEVSVNSVGDRVMVDQNSIRRDDNRVRYWEYRELRRTDSSGLSSSQPVYGMMLYRSVNCDDKTSRVQRLVLFNQNRQVIRRVNYEETGGLSQSMLGSTGEAAVRFVCEQS
jgi:hypothetical protein